MFRYIFINQKIDFIPILIIYRVIIDRFGPWIFICACNFYNHIIGLKSFNFLTIWNPEIIALLVCQNVWL